MTIKIKVCGITDEKEMKEIEKLNINRIGFINIERSKRNVSVERLKEFENNLSSRRVSTLVLEPENAYEVIEKIDKTGIRNIQLHSLNYSDIRYIQWLNQYHNCEKLNITKVIGLKDEINEEKRKEIENYCLYCDNILFDYVKDGKTGGTNKQIPIETAVEASKIVKNMHCKTEVTLAGGLNAQYIKNIRDKLKYFDRIDLNSGVEKEPGRKNLSKIKEIIEIIDQT